MKTTLSHLVIGVSAILLFATTPVSFAMEAEGQDSTEMLQTDQLTDSTAAEDADSSGQTQNQDTQQQTDQSSISACGDDDSSEKQCDDDGGFFGS